jgi:hypothetical protein
MSETMEVWHMPQWMEPYRALITNTGGNSVESLMNDKATSSFNNLLRWTLICSVRSQVTMLERMFEADLLTPFGHVLADGGNGAVQCHVCRSMWPSVFAIQQTTTCGEIAAQVFPERD